MRQDRKIYIYISLCPFWGKDHHAICTLRRSRLHGFTTPRLSHTLLRSQVVIKSCIQLLICVPLSSIILCFLCPRRVSFSVCQHRLILPSFVHRVARHSVVQAVLFNHESICVLLTLSLSHKSLKVVTD